MKKIIFIAGAGRSGTTMLDAVLGNIEGYFSCGELINYSIHGLIRNEYCACGNPVKECEFWSEVFRRWEEKRKLNLEEYNMILKKYFLSYKHTFKILNKLKDPENFIKDFICDTKVLYEVIFDVSKAKVIIDSSKNPLRLLLLRKLGFDLEVIYVMRRFDGVLNSNKKYFKKNLKAGVEKERKPLGTFVTLRGWVLTNYLTNLFSKGLKVQKLRYEELISNFSNSICKMVPVDKEFREKLNNRGPFYNFHIVAGNKMRMLDHFHVLDNPEGKDLPNLSSSDKIISKFVNKLLD